MTSRWFEGERLIQYSSERNEGGKWKKMSDQNGKWEIISGKLSGKMPNPKLEPSENKGAVKVRGHEDQTRSASSSRGRIETLCDHCNKGEAQVYWEDMNRDKEREKKRKEGRRGKGKREGRKGTKEKREEIGKRGTRRKRERERVILVTFSPPKKKTDVPDSRSQAKRNSRYRQVRSRANVRTRKSCRLIPEVWPKSRSDQIRARGSQKHNPRTSQGSILKATSHRNILKATSSQKYPQSNIHTENILKSSSFSNGGSSKPQGNPPRVTAEVPTQKGKESQEKGDKIVIISQGRNKSCVGAAATWCQTEQKNGTCEKWKTVSKRQAQSV